MTKVQTRGSLQQKIFMRVLLLLLLVIVSLFTLALVFKRQELLQTTLVHARIHAQEHAKKAQKLLLWDDRVALFEMMDCLPRDLPIASIEFIEKGGHLFIASDPNGVPREFLNWATKTSENTAIRRFKNESGRVFYDYAVRIKTSEISSANGAYLHMILEQDKIITPANFMVISVIGFLAVLLSIPISKLIAHRTVTEVERLTHQLQMHKKQLEEMITKRTASLHESEARFKGMFDHMSSGVVVFQAVNNGADFVILDINPASEKIESVSRKDVLGKCVTEVFPMIEKFGLLDVFRRVWETGSSEYHPIKFYTDDRIEGWRENQVYQLPSGEIVAIYDDVTDRKQAEEKLRLEHECFVTVMNSIDAIVYVADMDTHEVLFANKRITQQHGDLIGKICWKAIQNDQTGPCEFCTNDKLLNADGKPNAPYIWEFQNTGDKQWYQCRDQAIPWPDGRMVRIEMATDITARKKEEKTILQRERYLRGLNKAEQVLLTSKAEIPFQIFVDGIGSVSGASRAYVFLNHTGANGQLLSSQKVEWCAEGVPSEIDNPELQEFSFAENLPQWEKTLSAGGSINRCRSEFSAAEHNILAPQGIHSILIIPLIVGENFFGFVGFDNCISDRKWSPIEEVFLRTGTKDLATAIHRMQTEQQTLTSLKEKEVLLREIHHRVKNNMQVIVSLLRMHSRETDDQQLLNVFENCQDRVNAMSLIHEALYQSENLAQIDFGAYLKNLYRNLSQAHGAAKKGIQIEMSPCSVQLDMDQGVAVGMIISELVSNAFKHAFISKDPGQILINLSETGKNEAELIIQDSGQGLPAEVDISNPSSLGLRLVNAAVTRELNGNIRVERDNGTRFIIRFKCKGVQKGGTA